MSRLAAIAEIVRVSRFAGSFKDQVETFVAEASRLAADGLTLVEVGHLFTALIALAVDAAQRLANSGEQKKAFVLNAVGYLYDTIAPAVPLPWFLSPFRTFLRPYVRALVLSLADGAVEGVLSRLRIDPMFPTP